MSDTPSPFSDSDNDFAERDFDLISSRKSVISTWGTDAWEAIRAIRKGEYRRRRNTILGLAHYISMGLTQKDFFDGRFNAAVGKTIHNQLLKHDEAYAVAFALIIGSPQEPGLALTMRADQYDTEMHESLFARKQAIIEARFVLRDKVVKQLESLLESAGSEYVRVQAASMIERIADSGLSEMARIEKALEKAVGKVDFGNLSDEQLAIVEAGGEPLDMLVKLINAKGG